MYGQDMYYIPRTLVRDDSLFGEDTLSTFDDATELEMYIKNIEGFEISFHEKTKRSIA